ncbi:GNAT family N-acetyltransferase [Aestuariivirga litoralis]|uniref:GNAT family N-acetyltransferase n=1 Tax=Aestuariivirga litoralis TaxID=2650924 RepID=UPI0018C60FB9|nr:GNAT family N-acetyltransferase [Aestuariivirga litoralis]MBG1232059.1 GNAT family N-acetyltransferase [Aestuariivirga litoralis]
MEIRPGNFDDARVRALLEYHLRGMHASSPPGHVFALDWSGLQKPGISFWVIWVADQAVAMGALKELGDGTGEIKSMRVADGQAGKGYGKAMLAHIIAEAKARGLKRLSLETGSGGPFDAAVGLYRANGFKEGDAFGDYVKSDFCQFFHLDLV